MLIQNAQSVVLGGEELIFKANFTPINLKIWRFLAEEESCRSFFLNYTIIAACNESNLGCFPSKMYNRIDRFHLIDTHFTALLGLQI